MNGTEVMGKMRLANTTLGSAAIEMEDAYENSDVMLTPAKAEELAKIVGEMEASLARIKPVVAEFSALGARRVHHG